MEKEEWQAKTIVPKPFQTVQFGAAAIKKAFSPQFLTIKNARDKVSEAFWQKVMEYYLNEQHAKYVTQFADACLMGLAIGTSQEMIPRFIPGKGLEFALVEPWKIIRDPDAVPRDPQSGMYWVHEEWLDYYVLKEAERRGKYVQVAACVDTSAGANNNPLTTQEAIATRKNMIIERSRFRKMVLTREFHGTVLAPSGEMLLPAARLTLGSNRVIELPRAIDGDYRFPGVSFSPLPHLLRYDGRGLLEGVLSLWEAMNNILCLHQDYLQWLVNPPREINVDGLNDPKDAKIVPGKDILVKDTPNGQQVIRIEQRRSRTNDVLAQLQHYDQLFQRGTFVSDSVQGMPGWRQDEPYRLAAMHLDQALGVFGLMGGNVEVGAIQSITLAAQVIRRFAGYKDYLEIFSEEELKKIGVQPDAEAPSGVNGVPEFDGTFHVSGIQALMKDSECLRTIREMIIPLSGNPRYAPYINPFRVLKAIEVRTNLGDEKIIATDEEAQIIEVQQQLAAAKEQEAMEKVRDLQEALGVTELIKAIKEIQGETKNVPEMAKRIMMLEGGRKNAVQGAE